VSVVVDEAISNVAKTASEEAKKVESSIKAKGPKPAAKKDSSSTATNKPKGRPKKSS
jgi:ribosomal protein S10